jgi:hypothetical protein
MVTARRAHPIRLVGPWYRWQRQRDEPGTALGPPPRGTRPVFLKYTSAAEAVKLFLKDPQRSYRFYEDEDRWSLTADSPYTGRVRSLRDREVVHTPVRKLFRDTHRRSYLVVCEMHCDLPGLPDAGWGHAEETGFVVRRWVPRDPAWLRQETARLALEIGWLRAIRLRLQGRTRTVRNPWAPTPQDPAWVQPLWLQLLFTPPSTRAAILSARLEAARAALRALQRPDRQRWKLQWWQRDPEHDGIGRWRDFADEAEERPEALEALEARGERVYPLYRLIPDPREKDHLARGARLLFATVPTGDMETTAEGDAHLDHRDTYEIRCFVHQVRDCCSGRPDRGRCPERLRWTEPTEPYRIAPHFDPVGTGNTVVQIEMPDIKEIMAQPGGSPIRFVWPEGSMPQISGLSFPPGGGMGGGGLCSTSIPLVTIVATFLLELLTPIVVYLFGLYHLLLGKFCFPPGGLPSLPGIAGTTMLADRDAEYEDPADFSRPFEELRVPSRTERLEWEALVPVRPAVDDPLLAGVA